MKSSITNQPSLPVWKRRAAWLALIPAVVILCLAVMPQAQSSQANINNTPLWPVWARLEGSWLATVTFGEGGTLESPVSFTPGGVMIGSQPSSPDILFTAWHGAWTRKGPRDFAHTAIAFYYDTPNSEVWKIILKETLRIEPDGDTYNSTSSSVEGFGPNGEHWGPTEGDSTHGVRIKAE